MLLGPWRLGKRLMNPSVRVSGKLVIVVALFFVMQAGCKKHRPPNPNAQAPTITVPLSPTPHPTPAPPGPAATPQPSPTPQQTQANSTGTTTATKRPRHHKSSKPSTTTEASNASPEPPPSPIGQLSSGLSQDDDSRERQTTAELLDGTEANLKRITRTLSTEEQATLTQIRNFEAQAKTAIEQGDPVRAHTLALKANLLSAELLKQH